MVVLTGPAGIPTASAASAASATLAGSGAAPAAPVSLWTLQGLPKSMIGSVADFLSPHECSEIFSLTCRTFRVVAANHQLSKCEKEKISAVAEALRSKPKECICPFLLIPSDIIVSNTTPTDITLFSQENGLIHFSKDVLKKTWIFDSPLPAGESTKNLPQFVGDTFMVRGYREGFSIYDRHTGVLRESYKWEEFVRSDRPLTSTFISYMSFKLDKPDLILTIKGDLIDMQMDKKYPNVHRLSIHNRSFPTAVNSVHRWGSQLLVDSDEVLTITNVTNFETRVLVDHPGNRHKMLIVGNKCFKRVNQELLVFDLHDTGVNLIERIQIPAGHDLIKDKETFIVKKMVEGSEDELTEFLDIGNYRLPKDSVPRSLDDCFPADTRIKRLNLVHRDIGNGFGLIEDSSLKGCHTTIRKIASLHLPRSINFRVDSYEYKIFISPHHVILLKGYEKFHIYSLNEKTASPGS